MNPWTDLPHTDPFVLPSDRPLIDAFNARADPLHKVQTQAIPEPFFGRFDAPVVLLLLNPGFSSDGLHIPEAPEFLRAMREYLTNGNYDHLHLQPGASGPGARWWMQRMRALIAATSQAEVAGAVLSLEFFPYHSIKFAHAKVRVPSQKFTFELLEVAMLRNAVIVAARGFRFWVEAVPSLAGYHKVMRPRSSQNMSISHGNLGVTEFTTLVNAVTARK